MSRQPVILAVLAACGLLAAGLVWLREERRPGPDLAREGASEMAGGPRFLEPLTTAGAAGGRLRGTVNDGHGRGMTGATVVLVGQSPATTARALAPLRAATTGAGGAFARRAAPRPLHRGRQRARLSSGHRGRG